MWYSLSKRVTKSPLPAFPFCQETLLNNTSNSFAEAQEHLYRLNLIPPMKKEAGCHSRMISHQTNQYLTCTAYEPCSSQKGLLDHFWCFLRVSSKFQPPKFHDNLQGFRASSSCRVDRSSRRVLDSKIKYWRYIRIFIGNWSNTKYPRIGNKTI